MRIYGYFILLACMAIVETLTETFQWWHPFALLAVWWIYLYASRESKS